MTQEIFGYLSLLEKAILLRGYFTLNKDESYSSVETNISSVVSY